MQLPPYLVSFVAAISCVPLAQRCALVVLPVSIGVGLGWSLSGVHAARSPGTVTGAEPSYMAPVPTSSSLVLIPSPDLAATPAKIVPHSTRQTRSAAKASAATTAEMEPASSPASAVIADRATPDVSKLAPGSDIQINLNSATQNQLERLPGIGPSYAARILAYRTEHGAFQTVSEIRNVKGIGEAKLARIEPFLSI
jgi:competence ComEA-like helix-hairpin-helix protein